MYQFLNKGNNYNKTGNTLNNHLYFSLQLCTVDSNKNFNNN